MQGQWPESLRDGTVPPEAERLPLAGAQRLLAAVPRPLVAGRLLLGLSCPLFSFGSCPAIRFASAIGLGGCSKPGRFIGLGACNGLTIRSGFPFRGEACFFLSLQSHQPGVFGHLNGVTCQLDDLLSVLLFRLEVLRLAEHARRFLINIGCSRLSTGPRRDTGGVPRFEQLQRSIPIQRQWFQVLWKTLTVYCPLLSNSNFASIWSGSPLVSPRMKFSMTTTSLGCVTA